MIRQTTILTAGWMKDSTYGLRVMLAAIPETKTFTTPELDALMVKAIYNDQEDECLMSDDGPSDLPALVVMCDTDPELEAVTYKPGQLAQRLMMAFIYVTAEEVPEMEARMKAHLIGRAVRKVINKFNHGSIRTERSLNMLDGIKIVEVKSITEQRVVGKIGRSTLKGAVLADLESMDTAL